MLRRSVSLLFLLIFLIVGCGAPTSTTPTTAPSRANIGATGTTVSASGSAPASPTTSSATQTSISSGPTAEASPATAISTQASTAGESPTEAGATPQATLTSMPSRTPSGAATTPTAVALRTTQTAQAGYPLTYTGADGVKVTLKARPERIVSLFPVNNDTLFSIGAGKQIIAVGDFTHWPKAAASKPSIGGANQFDFNVEKIVSLKPDLVITSFGTQKILDKPLRDAGIQVIVTPFPTDLQQTYKLMRDLGRITGHEQKADQLVTKLRNTVQTVKQKTRDADKVSVYYEGDASTPGKPFTIGPGSLINQLIGIAGGKNVFGDAKTSNPQVSTEAIIAADPQVIVLGDAKGHVPSSNLNPVTIAQVKQRTGFDTISAVQHNRIVPINPDLFSPGPRLIQGLRELAEAIHPEIFGKR